MRRKKWGDIRFWLRNGKIWSSCFYPSCWFHDHACSGKEQGSVASYKYSFCSLHLVQNHIHTHCTGAKSFFLRIALLKNTRCRVPVLLTFWSSVFSPINSGSFERKNFIRIIQKFTWFRSFHMKILKTDRFSTCQIFSNVGRSGASTHGWLPGEFFFYF